MWLSLGCTGRWMRPSPPLGHAVRSGLGQREVNPTPHPTPARPAGRWKCSWTPSSPHLPSHCWSCSQGVGGAGWGAGKAAPGPQVHPGNGNGDWVRAGVSAGRWEMGRDAMSRPQ